MSLMKIGVETLPIGLKKVKNGILARKTQSYKPKTCYAYTTQL